MRAPAVTVVLIVHNTAPWLRACLDSLGAQSFRDFDVVAIDVASDLATKRALWRHSRQLPRVRIVTKYRNIGGAAAGNLGIRLARGEYVFLMDSDDVLPPGALAGLYRAAAQNHYDVTIGRALSLEGKKVAPMRYSADVLTWARPLEVASLRERPELTSAPYYWGRLYRREFLRRNRIEMIPGRIYADRYFSTHALLASRLTGVISDLTYLWRRAPQIGETTHPAEDQPAKRQSITRQVGLPAAAKDRLESFAEVESLFTDPADAEVLRYVRLSNLMRLFIHTKRTDGDELATLGRLVVPYARTFTEAEVSGCEFLLVRHKVQWYLISQERWADLGVFLAGWRSAPEPEPIDGRLRHDFSTILSDLPEAVCWESAFKVTSVTATMADGGQARTATVKVLVPDRMRLEPLCLVIRRKPLDQSYRMLVTDPARTANELVFTAALPPPEAEQEPLFFEYVANGRFGSVRVDLV